MPNEVDTYIAGFATDSSVPKLYDTAPKVVAKESATAGEAYVLDVLDLAIQKLFENDVKESTKIVATVSPRFYTILKKAYRFEDTNNSALLKNGVVGMYGKVVIKLSNNVKKTDEGKTDNIMIRTQRAGCVRKTPHSHRALSPGEEVCRRGKGLHLVRRQGCSPQGNLQYQRQIRIRR